MPEDEQLPVTKKSRRRSYSVAQKKEFYVWLDSVDAGEVNLSEYVRLNDIPRETISKWKNHREDFERYSLSQKRKRGPGAGAKPTLAEF